MPADSIATQDVAEQDVAPPIQTNDVKLSFPPPPPLPPPLPIPLAKSFVQATPCIKRDASLSQNEVGRACKRFLGNKFDSSIIACYTETQTVLQDGPMCGLVALEMAAQCLRPNNIPRTADIYEEAKNLKYTLQGEMFSADNMGHLAQKILNCEATVLSQGLSCKQEIVQALVTGKPVLVPYDADCNHEPCCKKGHKAHWAVLVGIVFVLKDKVPFNLKEYKQDCQVPNLYHATPTVDKTVLLKLDHNSLYVLARQGKSTHLGLWSLGALEESNANLIEMDPNRSREENNYVIPGGGIEQGLCRKIIFLST